jgi:hypothetical protein
MTLTTDRPPAQPRAERSSTRGHTRAAGILYLITFASSIPAAFVLLGPVLDDPHYFLGAGADTQVLWGCLLDIVNALAAVGTAVALFPVVRRHNESLALGFVTSRMFEAAVIMIGVVSLLTVVTLRQDLGGPTAGEPAALAATGEALVAARDWTYLLGPTFMAAINALLLGTLLLRARLVPRVIPAMGLVGAPLLLAAGTAAFFGLTEQGSGWMAVATLPIAAWELTLGIWMTVKGFKPSTLDA